MAEYVGSTPQQFDAGFCLFLLGIRYDFLQVGFVFFNGLGFFAEVYIVEAVVFDTHFLHEFKAGVHFVLGSLNLVSLTVPGEFLCSATELVTTFCAKSVPPCHGELQPFAHFLTHDYFIGIVITECHRVLALFTFEFNLSYSGKILFCCHKNLMF